MTDNDGELVQELLLALALSTFLFQGDRKTAVVLFSWLAMLCKFTFGEVRIRC